MKKILKEAAVILAVIALLLLTGLAVLRSSMEPIEQGSTGQMKEISQVKIYEEGEDSI